ncbi:hypothetical protein Ahia01_000278600 [Argonauta hians]
MRTCILVARASAGVFFRMRALAAEKPKENARESKFLPYMVKSSITCLITEHAEAWPNGDLDDQSNSHQHDHARTRITESCGGSSNRKLSTNQIATFMAVFCSTGIIGRRSET